MPATTVVGIDGCKTGWIAVCLRGDRAEARYLPTISAVTALAPDAAAIAIDIPIDLPLKGRRESDAVVRAALGARRNSLFFTPVRAAIEAPTHADACAAWIAAGAGGISQQAYRLGPKILEVAAWLPTAPCPVKEVHPELSFSVMLDHPAVYPKTTWGGIDERTRALAGHGIALDDVEPEAARRAAPDDMLDAAACAWTARRIAAGTAESFVDIWA